MNRKTNNKSITLYFLKMVIIFLIINLSVMLCATIVTSSFLFAKYGEDVIIEVFYSILVLIVMLLFHNSYVFTERKEGFWKSVSLAVPMIIISLINFSSGIIEARGASLDKLINVFVLSIFVGIAEEFLCRGWLQNEFIERFSHNKKEIITSIVLSSFVFGFMHLSNIVIQTPLETVLQVINAVSLGLLLGAVYYKTKNIWSVIFLHAFYDFAIFLNQVSYIKDCTYNTPTLAISAYELFSILVLSCLWILGFISVIRKCDFNELSFKKKKNNTFIYILMGITFLTLYIPFEKLIPEYKDYKVCYTYNEISKQDNYTIHYPYYKKYMIRNDIDNSYEYENDLDKLLSFNNYEYSVSLNDNNTVIVKNINTGYEYKLEFSDVVDILVLEREDDYILVVQTSENESTIYYSNYFRKDNMSNDDNYLKNITFKKFELPEIDRLGYISYNEGINYPYMISSGYDEFIIMDDELYLLK